MGSAEPIRQHRKSSAKSKVCTRGLFAMDNLQNLLTFSMTTYYSPRSHFPAVFYSVVTGTDLRCILTTVSQQRTKEHMWARGRGRRPTKTGRRHALSLTVTTLAAEDMNTNIFLVETSFLRHRRNWSMNSRPYKFCELRYHPQSPRCQARPPNRSANRSFGISSIS